MITDRDRELLARPVVFDARYYAIVAETSRHSGGYAYTREQFAAAVEQGAVTAPESAVAASGVAAAAEYLPR